MRILVVGGGGREHALVWRFAQDGHEVAALPGNPGTATIVANLTGTPLEAARNWRPDLIVIGPEDPLVAGLADELRSAGFVVFGPGADGAKLEASKAFSKALMAEAGVPTAAAGTFFDARSAADYARSRFAIGREVVVKASGNALGKGVVVCDTLDEAIAACQMMLVDRAFGEAGDTVVIEDRLRGPEFSLLTIVSGDEFWSLPVAQDYKRIGDGDTGRNTGGMGTYSPVAAIRREWVADAEDRVMRPVLRRLAEQGIAYRGMLFSGLMVQDGEVNCLEFNVRFGDPETQTIMRRLGSGLAESLAEAARGDGVTPVEVREHAAVTVVVASEGYPGAVEKGRPITIGSLPDEVIVFHAGTVMAPDLVTGGGRVFGVSAIGDSIAEARSRAYQGVEAIQFEGMQFRRDIAGT